MSDVVIRAEGLGKKYLIGHQSERRAGATFRDMLADTTRGLLRSAKDIATGRQLVAGDEVEEFWALKDINFEIKRGEVVGIIGRNGAGKSTLLKVLSRITEPTEGRVEIKGRIASLLEVGTGFHSELTGRENIYLNGAILGMSRAEIRRKFEEIVDFSGVEKFLDTPVKRYSSGMYVRLAFAVAAHLEPEILIVDEVLAVGDAAFQKKSLGKMHDVAKEGRTVMFVSHNMAAVAALCDKTALIHHGLLSLFDATANVVSKYLAAPSNKTSYVRDLAATDHSSLQIAQVSLDIDGEHLDTSYPLSISVTLTHDAPSNVALGIKLIRLDGTCVLHLSDEFSSAKKSRTRIVTLPPQCLAAGRYALTASIGIRNVELIDEVEGVVSFTVLPATAVARQTTGTWLGLTSPEFGTWTFPL